MNRKMIARELVLVAKNLIAEDKDGYVYDPDHKNKPKGGGWEKTEKGWTQNKGEDSRSKSGNNAVRKKDNMTSSEFFQKADKYDPKTGTFDGKSSRELAKSFKETFDRVGTQIEFSRYRNLRKSNDPNEIAEAFTAHKGNKKSLAYLGVYLVGNKNCPNEFLQDTIKDLAKHENGPFGDVDMRFHFHYAISKNPNSSPETLDKLYDAASGDANYLKYDDALNLLKHKNTSEKTVNKIVSDYMEYPEDDKYGHRRDRRSVLLPAISNPKISTGNLATLAEDKDTFVKRNARKKLAERANKSIDLSKLSPELREKVKGMSPEELGKFLGWLKKRKSGGGAPAVEEESEM